MRFSWGSDGSLPVVACVVMLAVLGFGAAIGTALALLLDKRA